MSVEIVNGNKQVASYNLQEFVKDVLEASEGGKYVLSDSNDFAAYYFVGSTYNVTLVPAQEVKETKPHPFSKAAREARKAVEEAKND